MDPYGTNGVHHNLRQTRDTHERAENLFAINGDRLYDFENKVVGNAVGQLAIEMSERDVAFFFRHANFLASAVFFFFFEFIIARVVLYHVNVQLFLSRLALCDNSPSSAHERQK